MAPTDSASQPAQQGHAHGHESHGKKKKPNRLGIAPITAFYIFLAANLLSALFAPIQDCDETFNYWEPAHYLSHGYGLQTWEYSPDYAIRSWTYVSEFYFIRYGLALICSSCQTLLFRAISTNLNPRIGIFFVLATVLTPGNFHANTAFLPSSFALYASLLGAAAFMDWLGGLKTSQGIFWFAVGGVIGWPFASALCFPFVLEEVLIAALSDSHRFWESAHRLTRGILGGLLAVGIDASINTFFYRKLETVPWNIVKYNIFSSSGGPNLYGTEPWTFYFRNLAINFNIWFILALSAMPLFFLQKLFSTRQHGFQSGMRTIVFLSPFYMWLGIFTLQPHKEERFMYPAYPFLALNASMALHILLSAFGKTDPSTLVGKIPAKLKLLVVMAGLTLSFNLGMLRIVGVTTGYSAPLKLYEPLGAGVAGEVGIGRRGDHVCFGKEWYRFPSTYFLPRDMRAKFIRSEFRGLLPGEFSEARTGFGVWSGTWLPTNGMNDMNEEDMGKYTDIRQCGFLVDTRYPESNQPLPPNEPDYVADTDKWEVVKCEPFLDAANTPMISRVLWVPDFEFIPDKYKRKWGEHCLLKKKPQA